MLKMRDWKMHDRNVANQTAEGVTDRTGKWQIKSHGLKMASQISHASGIAQSPVKGR